MSRAFIACKSFQGEDDELSYARVDARSQQVILRSLGQPALPASVEGPNVLLGPKHPEPEEAIEKRRKKKEKRQVDGGHRAGSIATFGSHISAGQGGGSVSVPAPAQRAHHASYLTTVGGAVPAPAPAAAAQRAQQSQDATAEQPEPAVPGPGSQRSNSQAQPDLGSNHFEFSRQHSGKHAGQPADLASVDGLGTLGRSGSGQEVYSKGAKVSPMPKGVQNVGVTSQSATPHLDKPLGRQPEHNQHPAVQNGFLEDDVEDVQPHPSAEPARKRRRLMKASDVSAGGPTSPRAALANAAGPAAVNVGSSAASKQAFVSSPAPASAAQAETLAAARASAGQARPRSMGFGIGTPSMQPTSPPMPPTSASHGFGLGTGRKPEQQGSPNFAPPRALHPVLESAKDVEGEEEDEGYVGEEDGGGLEEEEEEGQEEQEAIGKDKDDRANDTLCPQCDDGGDIIQCDGMCMRSFHMAVTGDNDTKGACNPMHVPADLYGKLVKDDDPFLCPNCLAKCHQCFVCGKEGLSSNQRGKQEVFKCAVADCTHFYHPACIGKTHAELAAQPLLCGLHHCQRCGKGGGEGEKLLVPCRRCPTAYHMSCLPPSVVEEAQFNKRGKLIAPKRLWIMPNDTGETALCYCPKHVINPETQTPDHVVPLFPPDLLLAWRLHYASLFTELASSKATLKEQARLAAKRAAAKPAPAAAKLAEKAAAAGKAAPAAPKAAARAGLPDADSDDDVPLSSRMHTFRKEAVKSSLGSAAKPPRAAPPAHAKPSAESSDEDVPLAKRLQRSKSDKHKARKAAPASNKAALHRSVSAPTAGSTKPADAMPAKGAPAKGSEAAAAATTAAVQGYAEGSGASATSQVPEPAHWAHWGHRQPHPHRAPGGQEPGRASLPAAQSARSEQPASQPQPQAVRSSGVQEISRAVSAPAAADAGFPEPGASKHAESLIPAIHAKAPAGSSHAAAAGSAPEDTAAGLRVHAHLAAPTDPRKRAKQAQQAQQAASATGVAVPAAAADQAADAAPAGSVLIAPRAEQAQPEAQPGKAADVGAAAAEAMLAEQPEGGGGRDVVMVSAEEPREEVTGNIDEDDVREEERLDPEKARQRVADLFAKTHARITPAMVKANAYEPVPYDQPIRKTIAMDRLLQLESSVAVAQDRPEVAHMVLSAPVLKELYFYEDVLRTVLAPFLHGLRYTSYGRHFTKTPLLQQVSHRLLDYMRAGDYIVDFSCGANEFVPLVKREALLAGFAVNGRSFDILAPKNMEDFVQMSWFDVKHENLIPGDTSGDRLVIGLNPPFGKDNALANKWVRHAAIFSPRIIVLIVPPGTISPDGYTMIYDDYTLMRDKAFYVPGSDQESWNKDTPAFRILVHNRWLHTAFNMSDLFTVQAVPPLVSTVWPMPMGQVQPSQHVHGHHMAAQHMGQHVHGNMLPNSHWQH